MEGTPFAVENTGEDDKDKEEKRKAIAEKPEALGILALEPAAEKEPSPWERVLAAIRPKAEAEEKPEAEAEETPLVPEAQPPMERIPQEDARRIVREMVVTEQQSEAVEDEEPVQAEKLIPEPEKPEPKPKAEVETVEVPEVPIAETPEPSLPAPEARSAETVEFPEENVAEQESVPQPEPAPEAHDKPIAEAEPAIAPVPVPEKPKPVEKPVEKRGKPADEDKKPGAIRSFFSRRKKKEIEKQPEPEPETVEQASPAEEKKPEVPEFQFNEKATEETAEKPEVAKEPETVPKPKPKPERIGQVLLNPEGAPERQARPVSEAAESSKTAEEKMKVEFSPVEPFSGKHVDTLSRAELMELGAKIEINGNNLRHIYETHLIGERGLRRLIAEHLRGGDVAKALRREVMEHEIDFERDPIMRDHVPITTAAFDSNNSALDRLLEKADVSMPDNSEQTAVYKAQARRQATSDEQQSHQRRLLDITLVATITFLTILIIIIFLARG